MARLAGRLAWWSSAVWWYRSSSRCTSLPPFTSTWKNSKRRSWTASRSFVRHAPAYRFQGTPRQPNLELETRITMPRHSRSSRPERLSLPTLCVIVVWYSGCTVGPKYSRPNVTTPAAYRGLTDDQAAKNKPSSLGDEEWSKVFQDQELQGLIRAALQNNYDVRIAAARVLEARAQLGITRADQFPSLSGGGNITSQRLAASGLIPGFQQTTGQLNVSAAWNLDFWGKKSRFQAAETLSCPVV